MSKSNHEILHDFTKDQTKTNIIEVKKEILCVLKVWNILGRKHIKDDIFEMASRSLDFFLGILSV